MPALSLEVDLGGYSSTVVAAEIILTLSSFFLFHLDEIALSIAVLDCLS